MILVSKYLVPRGYSGITLYPFIIVKHTSLKTNKSAIHHEKIHLKQQLELLIIGFYIWYTAEFLLKLWHYKVWQTAYKAISFEREAYHHENNFNYLSQRRFCSFLKYIRSDGL